MARAIWKGSISFGLVEIPVGLYPAESRDEIGFSLLDKRDFAPVGYKRYNKNTGQDIAWTDIVKGYEYEPGQYVIVTDEDVKAASPEKTQSIDIVGFVEGKDVAPWFYESPYYLEPLKKDSKGYALLRAALKRTGKVGIARVVLRTRQYLAAVVAHGDVLVLNTLRYSHEVRETGELTVPGEDLAKLGVSDREVQMAEQLIEGMSEHWEPAQYKDEYRQDLMARIEAKVKAGQTHVIEEPAGERKEPRRAEVVDLMPLLKQSLEQRGKAASTRSQAASAREEAPAPPRKAAEKKPAKKAAKSASKSRPHASRSA